ncbi:MAG: YoaK family protein [Spongiibacteraceae bacterium]
MINKLPRWVEIGGFFLALIAGCVNAIGLLGFKHQAVSHLTGTSTLLGLELANGAIGESVHLLFIMLGFVLGAAYSSAVIGNVALKLGRRYSVALVSEALLLVLAMYCLFTGSNTGHILASAACGLQNAMTSTYSGAVVRTTHVSGLFTDLGVIIGLRLRGQPADKRRVILYITLIAGFIIGGTVGALGFENLGFFALLMPAGLAALMALTYWIYWHSSSAYAQRANDG